MRENRMDHSVFISPWIVALALAWPIPIPAAPAAAQPLRVQSFGTTDEGITIIGYQDFLPVSGGSWGGSYERASDQTLLASINTIPNGAVLTDVAFYVRDNEPTLNVFVQVSVTEVDESSGQTQSFVPLQTGFSAGQPGETIVTLTINEPIVYRRETAPGDFKLFNYSLRAGADGDMGIRLARLRWRRQVSPAPAVASFDDVPTDHPYFRHIEALFDSGITAGCNSAPPMFCADRPITRGEMAVFLAKALGLHWPY